jgi:hypothetical protein
VSLKTTATDKRFWQGIITSILTAVLGYFGWEQVSQSTGTDVDIEIHTPEAEHTHKNWQPAIDKSKKEHEDEYH